MTMKIKLLPSKRPAPKWIPYVCALGYVATAALAVVALKSNYYYAIPAMILIIVFMAISKMFSWYVSAEMRKTNKFLVYEVENIIGVLGHNKTRYDIYSISKIQERGTRAFVYGEIVSHEPMSKARNIKRVVVDDVTDEALELLRGYIQ